MNLAQHFQTVSVEDDSNITDVQGDEMASMEAAVLDIRVAEHELNEVESVIEGFESVSEGLESYCNALAVTQESGDVDQSTAAWIMAAGEAITSRVGVSLNSVSVESFASPTDASDALELISLEADGIGQKLIDTIRAWIAKAREAIKKLWLKLTDGGAKLAKAGEALAKKAKDVKDASGAKAFEVSYLDKLATGDSADPSKVVSGADYIADMAEDLTSKNDAAVKKVVDAYKSYVEAAVKGEDKSDDFFKAARAFTKGFDTLKSSKLPASIPVPKGAVIKASEETLGGKITYIAAGGWMADGDTAAATFTANTSDARVKAVDAKGEIAPLSVSDVQKLATTITKVGKTIEGFNKSFQARDKMKGEIDKLVGDVNKSIKKGKDMEKAQADRLKDAVNAAKIVTTIMDKPAGSFAAHAVATMGTVASYANDSLKQHKKAK